MYTRAHTHTHTYTHTHTHTHTHTQKGKNGLTVKTLNRTICFSLNHQSQLHYFTTQDDVAQAEKMAVMALNISNVFVLTKVHST